MDIILENGQVIIDLDDAEFQAFEGMFANLNENHLINIDGLDWPEGSINDGTWGQDIKPIHLCRTIGEACAVESAGPLDIRSLYPFWKYGSARADGLLASTLRDSAGFILLDANPPKAVEHDSSGLAGSRRRGRRRDGERLTARARTAKTRRRP